MTPAQRVVLFLLCVGICWGAMQVGKMILDRWEASLPADSDTWFAFLLGLVATRVVFLWLLPRAWRVSGRPGWRAGAVFVVTALATEVLVPLVVVFAKRGF